MAFFDQRAINRYDAQRLQVGVGTGACERQAEVSPQVPG